MFKLFEYGRRVCKIEIRRQKGLVEIAMGVQTGAFDLCPGMAIVFIF